GMSEHSDAVIAIVSEETGAISIAVDGMLKRHLTPETFEKILRNELIVEDELEGRKKLDLFSRIRIGKKNG
ncbi:MAG: TIGR00159 family protein, partial [Oscillospiraceae bacterium]